MSTCQERWDDEVQLYNRMCYATLSITLINIIVLVSLPKTSQGFAQKGIFLIVSSAIKIAAGILLITLYAPTCPVSIVSMKATTECLRIFHPRHIYACIS